MSCNSNYGCAFRADATSLIADRVKTPGFVADLRTFGSCQQRGPIPQSQYIVIRTNRCTFTKVSLFLTKLSVTLIMLLVHGEALQAGCKHGKLFKVCTCGISEQYETCPPTRRFNLSG